MLHRFRPLSCGKQFSKSALLSIRPIGDLKKEVYAVHRVAGIYACGFAPCSLVSVRFMFRGVLPV